MLNIPERLKISPFLVFYLIQSMQVGVGILGYQRILAKSAQNDAWMAVIISGAGVHIILWMLYKILEKQTGDITDVHRTLFGKYIGNGFSVLLIIYFGMVATTVLRTYIEVVQVWVFPGIRIYMLAFIFLLIVYYIVSGGFRTVTGIAFLGVVLPSYLILALFFPLKYAFFENLLPIFDHSVKDILIASRDMTLSVIGFESILMFYPFIKEPKKSKKWAHLAVATTTFIYLTLMIVSLSYFSQEQLSRYIWATLTMLKIVQLPFVERFEYIAISSWLFVILPNVCIALWSASRATKRVFHKNQRQILIFFSFVIIVACSQVKTREQIDMLNNYTSLIGFYLLVGYVPVIFVISTLYYRWKRRKQA